VFSFVLIYLHGDGQTSACRVQILFVLSSGTENMCPAFQYGQSDPCSASPNCVTVIDNYFAATIQDSLWPSERTTILCLRLLLYGRA